MRISFNNLFSTSFTRVFTVEEPFIHGLFRNTDEMKHFSIVLTSSPPPAPSPGIEQQPTERLTEKRK